MHTTNPAAEAVPAAQKPAPARSSRSIEELIREQGVEESSKFENLVGRGSELWATDEEFDEFLQILKEARSEKR